LFLKFKEKEGKLNYLEISTSFYFFFKYII